MLTDPSRPQTSCLILTDRSLTYICQERKATPVERGAVEAFEKIAKEGRKCGVALMIVSQRPSDVSATILSQCNNIISLRLINADDQATVRNILPESLESLLRSITHHGCWGSHEQRW